MKYCIANVFSNKKELKQMSRAKAGGVDALSIDLVRVHSRIRGRGPSQRRWAVM